MDREVVNGDRVTGADLGDVGSGRVLCVDDNHDAAADHLEDVAIRDADGRILAEADGLQMWIGREHLHLPGDAVAADEMGVDDHVLKKADAAGRLNAVLLKARLAVAFVDHHA